MAQISSPITTYSDTTLQKRTITDVIANIDPRDTPFVEAIGGLDGASGKFNFVNRLSNAVEWAEDTLFALTDSITETIASNTTTLTVNDATVFQEGDIILCGSELMWCSAVSDATSIVVTRAFGSSSAATAADNATLTLVGQGRLQGDDSDDRGFTDRSTNSNYSQIFHHEVKVARTANQIPQYGISDEMMYQSEKQVPSLMRLIERNWFYGTRNAGSAAAPRTSGGLKIFITDNTLNCTPTSPTQANIEDAAQMAWEDGGNGPWLMPVTGDIYQAIKNLVDSSAFVRVGMEANRIGMVVDTVRTPFGDVNLLLDRWARTDYVFLSDVQHIGMLTLYPFSPHPLAKTGDADRAEVVGEFINCVRLDKAHAVLT